MSDHGNDYERFFVRQVEAQRDPAEEACLMMRRGESVDAIIRFLLESGYDERQTDRTLNALRKDRLSCIRRIGTNSILLGLLLILLGIVGQPLAVRFFNVHSFSLWVWIGAFGVGAVVTGLGMVFKPDRVTMDISKHPFVPPIVPADATRIDRALTQWLPPALGYGVLFLLIAIVVSIAAYLMYR